MLGLGFGEIVLLCIILIVVVGPERLPDVMKGVGKTMRTVRQASKDLRGAIGIDEMMREDVLRPPPPQPRKPPPASVSRNAEVAPAAPAADATAANTTPAQPAADKPAAEDAGKTDGKA
jgi:sec-independent protein translocase protein TatB